MGDGDGAMKRGRNEVLYDEWMSDSDALMWHIERDPLLRSTVLCVWILDRAPDPGRFAATLARTLRHVPRLRQKVVEDALGVTAPRWENDPCFDLEYHVRHLRAPGEGGLRQLLDYAAPVAMQAFDKDRPLWEFHCVEGLAEGRYGIVLKLHHAMSDGVGMVRMTEGLVERTREDPRMAERTREDVRMGERPPQDEPPMFAEPSGELVHLGEAMLHGASTALDRSRRAVAAFGRGLTHFAGHPVASGGELVDTLESVARLVRPVSEPLSPLWKQRSLGIHLDVLEIPVDAMKRAAEAASATMNDVFVAAVAGGLSRYHDAAGYPAEALRMSMPINVRGGDKDVHAGNRFVPARFAIPLDLVDPKQRVVAVHTLVRAQRDEPGLGFLGEISAAINVLGEAASTRLTGAMMKAVDVVTSNVPGPRFPVFLAGSRIEKMFPFGPTAGAALNITLFSYDGLAQIGINADRAAIGNAPLLRASLEEGFAEVLAIS